MSASENSDVVQSSQVDARDQHEQEEGGMAKANVTLRYFGAHKGLDGSVATISPPGTPPGRQPIRRRGWNSEEMQVDWESLAEMIEHSSLPNAVFFLDSSFFDRHEVPWIIWKALLTRNIAFTPLVWNELADWREKPFANGTIRDSLVAATQSQDPRIQILDIASWEEPVRVKAEWYIELLASRKRIGHVIAESLKSRTGSLPQEGDLFRELQRLVRDRGLLLGKKGVSDVAKANFLADEQLIVCAVAHAVITGREMAILTRDADLVEQFYKFVYLLDTDHRAALIAESFARCPDNIITDHLPDSALTEVFEHGPKLFLNLPRRFADWVLPSDSAWSVASCYRLAGHGSGMKMSSISFCTDNSMKQALESSSIAGQRCVLCLSPPFPSEFGGNAVIAVPKTTPLGRSAASPVELTYAICEVEHFRRVRVDARTPTDDSNVGPSLAAFRLEERLMFSHQPEWFEISPSDLSAAIAYSDHATMFFSDQTFLASPVAELVASPLIERKFATTSHIRDWSQLENESICQPLRSALKRRSKSVIVYDVSADDPHRMGYGYYLTMLAFRKLFWRFIQAKMRQDHGRDSPDTEWPQIVEHYCGTRGRRVAEAAYQRREDTSLFFGDELLAQGLIASIREGADVVFLTTDPVVMDQFVKLCRFVKEHYLANLLSVDMLKHPDLYGMYKIVSEDGSKSYLLHDLAPNWESAVLPPDPFFVNLHCWLLDTTTQIPRICPYTFCAERPMHRMLATKARTGGLNANDPLGRNIRVGRVPSHREVASLFVETLVPIGNARIQSDTRLDTRLSAITETDLVHWEHCKENIDAVWFE